MIRGFFIAGAAAALACNSVQTVFAGGQLVSPTGLAATSASDRDVLFIANAGQDNLRALQLCNRALLADGGVTPGDTCPRNEDQQFLPGPIRVFPANIETGNRPLHLAGARLLQADGGATGAVLAVGADTDVRLLDARALVDAAHGKGNSVALMDVPLGTPVADVVAVNALDSSGRETGSPAVTALAVTVGPPALLVQMNLTVDSDGGVAQPAVVGQCTLDPVVPRRLAVAAGGDTAYIADSAGDGVVRVPIAAIAAGGACPADRIATGLGKRPTRSVAVSPTWYDDGGTVHPPGELVMMILEPSSDADAGTDLDPGGVLLARAADKRIVPIPPHDINDQTATLQPMEPIAPSGLPREGAFLPALDLSNCTPGDGGVAMFPCTPLYTGSPASAPFENFSLLAAVSSTDGNTYFIDVVNRRFVSSTYFDVSPPGSPANLRPGLGTPTLSASLGTTPAPQFNLAPADASDGGAGTHPFDGWVTPGVTRATTWQVEWHADMPGLQTRGGTLTPTASGTMLFKAGIDFSKWVNDPALALGVGDVVTFSHYLPPANAPQACIDLATTENQSPVRFETPIVSIRLPDTLELAAVPATDTTRAFNASACPGGLGAVATVRTARDQPWLVLEQLSPRRRIKTGDFFVGTDRRFNYPLDYTLPGAIPPLATDNSAIAFTLSGSEPGVSGARWTISTSTGAFPVFFGDTSINVPAGLASDVITYRSPRRGTQVFTSVTGQNSVVQADPLLPLTNSAAITGGVITYK